MTIRVLIADDQPVVRDGPGDAPDLIDDVEIVATAADGLEAVERARTERPDIGLMDLRMPRLEGAGATPVAPWRLTHQIVGRPPAGGSIGLRRAVHAQEPQGGSGGPRL
jgi:CheY-like chemotaxis protein